MRVKDLGSAFNVNVSRQEVADFSAIVAVLGLARQGDLLSV